MPRNVMILGCGRVGAMVAKALVAEGDDVTVLDRDADNFRRLAEGPNLHMVVADGTSSEELKRCGIEQVDAFISLTAQDTVNALAAQMAQLSFGVTSVICRINDPIRRAMYDELGLRTVSPPQVMTDLVLEALGN
jgi:trk system potassium uptake protein TrkA